MDILIGLQYGDEGKGKITDLLTEKYKIVARFQGGNNAGHTLYHNGQKVVLHHLPSSILHKDKISYLGNGMVLNPIQFLEEVEKIEKIDNTIKERIFINENIHLIRPKHIIEDKEKNGNIGTTNKGIGPCYRDKVNRTGLTIKHIKHIVGDEDFAKAAHRLYDEFNIVDNKFLRGKEDDVLAEGAQGTMLDIEYGSYPFVTSSNTISSYAPIGLGLSYNSINRVYGIFKCYLTRVGNGNMETELFDNIGKEIKDKGKEFGATTGRDRRCGWLNLDELEESVYLNGVTDLIMTKLDVLENFKTVKIYHKGKYIEFDGWKKAELSNEKLMKFIDYISGALQLNISMISVSPEKNGILDL
jgi:adenylosuccinate synthase